MDSIQLRALQMMEFEMLLEVDRICNKHNLRYYLIGGTALGAVRYGGFIPWDDDIDVAMPRHDYEQFLKICSQELPENYCLQTFKSQPHFPLPFAKVTRDDTTFIEASLQKLKIHHGIFVDVFPLDGVPRSVVLRAVQDVLVKIAAHIPIGVSKRLTFFRCFSIDWIISRASLDKSESWAYRFGGPREIMDRNVWGNPKLIEFEGHSFPVPQRCDAYLANLYGNYMEPPPVEQRNGHSPVVVDLHRSYVEYFR